MVADDGCNGILGGFIQTSTVMPRSIVTMTGWGPKILVVCCPRQENTPRGYTPAPSPATVPGRHQDSARGSERRQVMDGTMIAAARESRRQRVSYLSSAHERNGLLSAETPL